MGDLSEGVSLEDEMLKRMIIYFQPVPLAPLDLFENDAVVTSEASRASNPTARDWSAGRGP
jgi:hypothetical protein